MIAPNQTATRVKGGWLAFNSSGNVETIYVDSLVLYLCNEHYLIDADREPQTPKFHGLPFVAETDIKVTAVINAFAQDPKRIIADVAKLLNITTEQVKQSLAYTQDLLKISFDPDQTLLPF